MVAAEPSSTASSSFCTVRTGFTFATGKPTLAHHFVAELERRDKLLRYYTQNVDSLEVRPCRRDAAPH